ncbi:unnamed protein product [Ectocarpus sp. CCAP 1310/34]|nr:unnamed protein product [Ectocarpus sp. CCAP 1310/34]
MVAFIAAFLLRAIDSVVSCPIIAAVLDKCTFPSIEQLGRR